MCIAAFTGMHAERGARGAVKPARVNVRGS
ncbi:unnamed protein product [Callosobruchus maculatus]|uniref:Uncharacterized protein n=1 Tax=Callosobruchus maculatus TaxID=64391 RepID=A0A653CJW1_CALMS|nr:unnamed protein product [Callosobruchus maculatus]